MSAGSEREKRTENGKMRSPAVHPVSVWLDGYDDLFSDFDPRDYSERSISDDFITELKRHSAESELQVSEIKLLLPPDKRNAAVEIIISKRIRKHIQSLIALHEKKTFCKAKKGHTAYSDWRTFTAERRLPVIIHRKKFRAEATVCYNGTCGLVLRLERI